MCSRPYRPLGLPIYVTRVPAAPFSLLPRRFTFYVAEPISSIRMFRDAIDPIGNVALFAGLTAVVTAKERHLMRCALESLPGRRRYDRRLRVDC